MLSTIALTILFTVVFLVVYKLVVNPQIVLTVDVTKMAKCPDGWTYSVTSQMCEPNYKTHCLPFNPELSSLNTAVSKCNIARACGTTWSGFCG